MPTQTQPESWHLDRRVPLALIFTLLLQIFSFGWVASEMNSDININRKDIDRTVVQLERLQVESNQQAVQLGRIEEGIRNMDRNLQDLVDVIRTQNSKGSTR